MRRFTPSFWTRTAIVVTLVTSAIAGYFLLGRTGSVHADPIAALTVDVPAISFVLPNGLTVVVHEDHSAPLVAVHVWYHVGSKNEPAGRSGFAHLFEHLMFNGSEHFNDDFFKATQKIGATHQNGSTSVDVTNYYQTVPRAALDTMLWLESDRMGHLLGAVDQARLEEQRAVVKNEKRQGDNQPYAKAWELMIRATAPAGHPYDHEPVGSMADLDAATLDDVRDWFRTWYGPSNAVLVLAGDITAEEVRRKVERYFGDIPPGTPVNQPQQWIVKRSGTIRETAYDRVAQPRLYRVWNVSAYTTADTDHLSFLADVLAGDKNSLLYKRLVIDERLATDVKAQVWSREIGGLFMLTVDVQPGGDIAQVETIVDEELQKLLASGPTPAELARIRTTTLAGFVRSLESLSDKASLLAGSQTFRGRPDAWKASYDRYRSATPIDLSAAGKRWLSDGDYVLHILPFGDRKVSGGGADRTTMPMPETVVPAAFPNVERATLGNGMKLIVAKRGGVPLVDMTLLFDTGVPASGLQIEPDVGPLTMDLLDEATTSRPGEVLVEVLASLGAKLSTGGGGETSHVSLSALKPALRESLAIYADVVRHPAFAQADFDRLKAQAVAQIASDKQDPRRASGRILPTLLFGPDHPYGLLATETSVGEIEHAEVIDFHARWFHPNNAALVVVGDTELAEIRPMVEEMFADWARGEVPLIRAPTAIDPTQARVYLIDKPGTPQTVIRAALVAPSRKQGDAIARAAFNSAFGGSFTARLNMKLREEKGWSYGAGSDIDGGRGAQIFRVRASVQADKTTESMQEIATMLDELVAGRPIRAEELAAAQDKMRLGLTGDWANNGGIARYLTEQQVHGLPDDYYSRYPDAVASVALATVNAEATSLISRRPLTWIVAGDLAKIEPAIRALGLGQVQVVDVDGRLVR